MEKENDNITIELKNKEGKDITYIIDAILLIILIIGLGIAWYEGAFYKTKILETETCNGINMQNTTFTNIYTIQEKNDTFINTINQIRNATGAVK